MHRSISKKFRLFTMLLMIVACIGGVFMGTAEVSARTQIPTVDEYEGGYVSLTTSKAAPMRLDCNQSDTTDSFIVPANSEFKVYWYEINRYGNIWYYGVYDDPFDGSYSVGYVWSGNFN